MGRHSSHVVQHDLLTYKCLNCCEYTATIAITYHIIFVVTLYATSLSSTADEHALRALLFHRAKQLPRNLC